MRTHWSSGLVAVAMVIGACSDGGAGTIGGGSAQTSDGFADQFCALYKPCCSSAGLRTDGSVCKAFVGLAAANGKYDAALGDRCLAELRAASSSPDFCGGSSSKIAPTCQSVYGKSGGSSSSGTKAPGEACTTSSDCASSSEGQVTCRFVSADNDVCQVQLDGKEGDGSCIGTKDGIVTSYTGSSASSVPSRGFICDRAKNVYCDATTTKCAALGGVDAPCGNLSGSGDACQNAFYCDTIKKTCAPALAAGDDCANRSAACGKLGRCDATTKKCIALDPDGAPCTSSVNCQSRICSNKVCGTGAVGSSSLQLSLLCGQP